MLYDKLSPQMRQTVDAYVNRLGPLAWNLRSDLLASAAGPFVEDLAPEQAQLAAKGFMTAVLERWDDTRVVDPRQACLYMISLNPRHRALAAEYLDANPHMRHAVRQELGEAEVF